MSPSVAHICLANFCFCFPESKALYYMKQPDWNPHQKGKKEAGKTWSPDEWQRFSEAQAWFSGGRKKKNKGVKRKAWWADRQQERRAWHSQSRSRGSQEPEPAPQADAGDAEQAEATDAQPGAEEVERAPQVATEAWLLPPQLAPLAAPHGSVACRGFFPSVARPASFPPEPPSFTWSRRTVPVLPKAMPMPRRMDNWGDTPGLIIHLPTGSGPFFVPNHLADQLLHGLGPGNQHSFMDRLFGSQPLLSFTVQNAEHPPNSIIDLDDEIEGGSSSSRDRPWRT